jgi:hypothetical protein
LQDLAQSHSPCPLAMRRRTHARDARERLAASTRSVSGPCWDHRENPRIPNGTQLLLLDECRRRRRPRASSRNGRSSEASGAWLRPSVCIGTRVQ